MCMRVTGHPSSSQPGAGSAQNASSGSPLDPTPAHNVAGNHSRSSTTQQPSQKPTGEQPPGGPVMTWDELEELRDRPENLTIDEEERYDMAISLGGHNVE